MHQISYAGGTFVTSDEVADVLIQYAAALANADRAATIDVPVGGLSEKTLQILVGPASQLMSAPIESDTEVEGTATFVLEARKRIEALQQGWITPAETSSVDWDI